KSVVAFGEADVFEVVVFAAGADTFLRGARAGVVAFFQAKKNILELVHAGVGKQQSRIAMRDERATAHTAMAFTFEKLQEHLTDFVAGHVVPIHANRNYRRGRKALQ
ncbi:MAG TPA: hypothetical protein VFF42_10395, partial [Candidatus Eremiobacteraceae bacterium]|nr:hypothetical protein [Candidatus Eremiobacteraceae bacterium]